jgi:cell division protease FtsH
MSDKLGLVELAPNENPYLPSQRGHGQEKPYSEETARTIDAEVLRIIKESHDEAKRLLNEHRKQLDSLSEALIKRETLDEQEILKVVGLPAPPPLEAGKLPTADESRKGPVPVPG